MNATDWLAYACQVIATWSALAVTVAVTRRGESMFGLGAGLGTSSSCFLLFGGEEWRPVAVSVLGAAVLLVIIGVRDLSAMAPTTKRVPGSLVIRPLTAVDSWSESAKTVLLGALLSILAGAALTKEIAEVEGPGNGFWIILGSTWITILGCIMFMPYLRQSMAKSAVRILHSRRQLHALDFARHLGDSFLGRFLRSQGLGAWDRREIRSVLLSAPFADIQRWAK